MFLHPPALILSTDVVDDPSFGALVVCQKKKRKKKKKKTLSQWVRGYTVLVRVRGGSGHSLLWNISQWNPDFFFPNLQDK